MKHLSDYTEPMVTKLFEETGAFFAFNKEQFEILRKEGVSYVWLGAGLICPDSAVERVVEGLDDIGSTCRALDLEENGKKAIIHRELANYEYIETSDISDTLSALKPYGITAEEIEGETQEYIDDYYEWRKQQEEKGC